MILVLLAIGLPAAYVLVAGIRWLRVRSLACAAVYVLHEEAKTAEQSRGETYGVRYGNPELMFQILTEVKDLLLALEGSLILMSTISWRRRMRWSSVRGYEDVIERAERGMKALNDAAFFAQFPPGARLCQDVVINGIPIRERC